jgi:hypothetical protein
VERDVLWSPWSEPGFEHLHLAQHNDGIIANGLIVLVEEDVLFRVGYSIYCDVQWRVQEVSLELLNKGSQGIRLLANGEGHWRTASGESMPSLDGCLDVDISATPFTNTLPIRRLGLAVGASSELTVTYIKVPEMQIRPERQRYTCLDTNPEGGLYRYEGLSTGFMAELRVDRDGLVIDYPGLFRRIWPGR